MSEGQNLSEMFISFGARYTQLSSESQLPSEHLEVCGGGMGCHVAKKLYWHLEERSENFK